MTQLLLKNSNSEKKSAYPQLQTAARDAVKGLFQQTPPEYVKVVQLQTWQKFGNGPASMASEG